jgi:hypothetical protein
VTARARHGAGQRLAVGLARGAPPVTRSGRLASSASSRAMLFSSARIGSVRSRYAVTTAS